VGEMRSILVLKIKESAASTQMAPSSGNIKNIVTGLTQCHSQPNTYLKEDASNLEKALMELTNKKELYSFTRRLLNIMAKDL
jgi:hypothetical protein